MKYLIKGIVKAIKIISYCVCIPFCFLWNFKLLTWEDFSYYVDVPTGPSSPCE